ncbi:MAG: hypothetical protein GX100_02020 [candidate division WS1 bacterium]|nr:hypothetical protein [candidate division WS1 bacterium]
MATLRGFSLLALSVVLGSAAWPALGASPFRNINNTPFRTRCNGPQGALLAPAEQAGIQPMAAPSVVASQHNAAGLGRAQRALRLLQQMWVKSPRAEVRFPRLMYRMANGQLVLPALASAMQTPTAVGDPDNNLTFEFQGFTAPDQQALAAYLQNAYPKMRQVYGPPAFNQTVTIIQDSSIQAVQGGVYDVSSHQIRIPPLSGNFEEDTFSLCMLVLHAFRGETALFYDVWESGMAGAAATVVQTTSGVSPGYNPVDPGPFYAWSVYEAQNQPALANSTFYPASGFAGMLYFRICMARTVWLKCWAENNDFFRAFNQAYYAAYSSTLPGDVPALKDVGAQVLPQVEGMSWYDWYQRQYILDTSVHGGLKLYTWNAPTVDGVILLVDHYLTSADGDESPRGGTGRLTYWNYDFSLSLYVEPSDTTVTVPASGPGAGEGALFPKFTSIGGPQRITVQLDLNGMRGQYPYPYGVRGDQSGENDFYGAVMEGPSATLDISGAYTKSGLTANRGVFGTSLSGSRLSPSQIVVQVANPQGQMVTRTINVGWDSYVTFLPGGGQAGLTHTWEKQGNGIIMMSLPVEPLQTNAAVVLGIDARKLLLARWDPTAPPDGAYRIWPTTEPFQPGRAYWLKLPADLTVNAEGLLPPPGQDYTVPLSLGWNMVGSPRQTPVLVTDLRVQTGTDETISFAEAINRGLVQRGFYAYTPGTGYQLADTLDPFDGYWLRCLVPGGARLIFPAVSS